ncbi:hypothetical protein DVH24_034852 [Malus domestica]|uniref:Uncharacterized protein n=1 Tax=Malus domestica TaxID=3750 RepID=A0A498IIX5_MALDO|nr:hypothetical protein DVH24_034852 [Malus domestica]
MCKSAFTKPKQYAVVVAASIGQVRRMILGRFGIHFVCYVNITVIYQLLLMICKCNNDHFLITRLLCFCIHGGFVSGGSVSVSVVVSFLVVMFLYPWWFCCLVFQCDWRFKRIWLLGPSTSHILSSPPICAVTVKPRQHFILLLLFVLLSV